MSGFDPIGRLRSNRDEWSLLVAGDCLLKGLDNEPSIGSRIVRRVRNADLSVVNLEGPVPSDGTPIEKSGLAVETVAETPELLAKAGFDLATLANNHSMDHGEQGLSATIRACDSAGVSTVGVGSGSDEAMEPFVTDIGGCSVAVLNLCEREFGVATNDEPGAAWISHPDVESVIRRTVADHDVVVAVAHGGVEYVPFPPPGRRRQLREFVDLGVDAVVGHHPHVPQGWELYRGRPIYYSLGNFLLYQQRRPNTRRGLLVELTFNGRQLQAVEPIPVQIGRESVSAFETDFEGNGYLSRISTITADPKQLEPYWQATAMEVFDRRYASNGVLSCVRYIVNGRLNGSAPSKDTALRELNLIRNESHSALIRTVLEVRSGVREDKRTDAIEAEVEELLQWTDDEPFTTQNRIKRKLFRA
jgi:hypothetical protein